ncbi:RidA family protein [Streptomyces zaomyceticus]|uniref:RidA family protein n=1 Tax=Streptomyces TaxID=1883 RepID=UPI003716D45E
MNRRHPRQHPDARPAPRSARQVSIATGSKLVFIAGRVAWDVDGATVGEGDVAAQVEQCYLHVGTALAGVGGSFDDVAKLTVYVVDWTPDKIPLLMEGLGRAAAKLGVTATPPASLLGVAVLDVPDHLAEIEATAVLG